MLHSRNLPLTLWAKAVNTAVYILNRTPCTQTPGTTLYEKWTGKAPNLSHLKIFGSIGYAHIPKHLRTKLESKTRKVIFVGYQERTTYYRLYTIRIPNVYPWQGMSRLTKEPSAQNHQLRKSKFLSQAVEMPGGKASRNERERRWDGKAGGCRRFDG